MLASFNKTKKRHVYFKSLTIVILLLHFTLTPTVCLKQAKAGETNLEYCFICEKKEGITRIYNMPGNNYFWELEDDDKYHAILSGQLFVKERQYLKGRIFNSDGKEVSLERQGQKHLDAWYIRPNEWKCSISKDGSSHNSSLSGIFLDANKHLKSRSMRSMITSTPKDYIPSYNLGCHLQVYEGPIRLFTEPKISSRIKNYHYRDQNYSFCIEKIIETPEGQFFEGSIRDGRGRPVTRIVDMPHGRYKVINKWFIRPEEWTCTIFYG